MCQPIKQTFVIYFWPMRCPEALRCCSTSTAAPRKLSVFSAEVLSFAGFCFSSSCFLQDVRHSDCTLDQLAADCLLSQRVLLYHSTFSPDGSKTLLLQPNPFPPTKHRTRESCKRNIIKCSIHLLSSPEHYV